MIKAQKTIFGYTMETSLGNSWIQMGPLKGNIEILVVYFLWVRWIIQTMGLWITQTLAIRAYTPSHYLLAVTQYAYLPNEVLNRAPQVELRTQKQGVCACTQKQKMCARD